MRLLPSRYSAAVAKEKHPAAARNFVPVANIYSISQSSMGRFSLYLGHVSD